MARTRMGDYFDPADEVQAKYNIGALLDVQTGEYYEDPVTGQMILNGGLSNMTGIGGQGNTFKSTLAQYMGLSALNRYQNSDLLNYDTEVSGSVRRLETQAVRFGNIGQVDLVREGRLIYTNASKEQGDVWFDKLKTLGRDKIKAYKDNVMTTPFFDRYGKPIMRMNNQVAVCDSLSRMPITAHDALLNKNNVGESGNNTEALKQANAKNQMLIQLPTFTEQAVLNMIFTMHVDTNIHLDPFSAPETKLALLGNKVKFKYVPSQVHFLMNNLWYVYSSSVYKNDTTKAPQYPRNDRENKDNFSKDLNKLLVQNLRGKHGASGRPYRFIVSQDEGLLVQLTEFEYLTDNDWFGINANGNKSSYRLDLCPDIALQRTTLRTKCDESARLRRAMEITSEMHQIFTLKHDVPRELHCSPEELFNDLKTMGYDWDELLEGTRGWWIHKEETHPLHHLTTYDLLRIRKGLYKPYWMQ